MKTGWLFLGLYSLTVIFRFWYFSQRGWRAPLKNGERYFLDVEVPEGWHFSGEGKKWWRRYWASILAPHALEAMAFLAIALWGEWSQLPLLSLVAPVFVAMNLGVVLWWRHSTGIDRRKPHRVAVDLAERRLGEYFSWQVDGLMLLLVVASWAALAGWGDRGADWRGPVISTYVVAGLAATKAGVVKHGWGLPAERTEEYQRWQNIRRMQAVRALDGFRWMILASLVGYAAVHSVGGVLPVEPVRWTAIAASVAVWLWMMASYVQGERALDRAGAGLPPAAMAIDWRKGWWGFGAFVAGLAALLIWLR